MHGCHLLVVDLLAVGLWSQVNEHSGFPSLVDSRDRSTREKCHTPHKRTANDYLSMNNMNQQKRLELREHIFLIGSLDYEL